MEVVQSVSTYPFLYFLSLLSTNLEDGLWESGTFIYLGWQQNPFFPFFLYLDLLWTLGHHVFSHSLDPPISFCLPLVFLSFWNLKVEVKHSLLVQSLVSAALWPLLKFHSSVFGWVLPFIVWSWPMKHDLIAILSENIYCNNVSWFLYTPLYNPMGGSIVLWTVSF